VPVGLYLCGASDIWTFDIASLLRPRRVEQVLRLFVAYHQSGALQARLPWVRPERMERLRHALESGQTHDPALLLKPMNIRVLVRDAGNSGLRSNSVHLFVSTSVLEYIPRDALASLFLEFKRL